MALRNYHSTMSGKWEASRIKEEPALYPQPVRLNPHFGEKEAVTSGTQDNQKFYSALQAFANYMTRLPVDTNFESMSVDEYSEESLYIYTP